MRHVSDDARAENNEERHAVGLSSSNAPGATSRNMDIRYNRYADLTVVTSGVFVTFI